MTKHVHPCFSEETLKLLLSYEKKVVKHIIYYIWNNTTNPDAAFQIIDNIGFIFSDNTQLVITCNEESNALDVISDFNPKQEQQLLEQEFNGKIQLLIANVSTMTLWQGIPNKQLQSIELSKENNAYLSDTILLNFGEEKRIIELSPTDEGLLVDFYEEN